MGSAREVVIEVVDDAAHAAELSRVAAATFPLACPPHVRPEDIAVHVAKALGPQQFSEWIADDEVDVIAARDGNDDAVIGYALVIHRPPSDPDVAAVVTEPSAEISKMYVLPDMRDGYTQRPAHALMAAALTRSTQRGAQAAWLGVNQLNERAQAYYRKMGFAVAGPRSFDLNGRLEHDYVMTRALTNDIGTLDRSISCADAHRMEPMSDDKCTNPNCHCANCTCGANCQCGEGSSCACGSK